MGFPALGSFSSPYVFEQVVAVEDMEAFRLALLYLKGRSLSPDKAIALEGPIQYVHLTTAQRDGLTGLPLGSTIFNTDTGQVESFLADGWAASGSGAGPTTPFYLHGDVSDRVITPGSVDRFLLSNEGPISNPTPGSPNAYIRFADLQRAIAGDSENFQLVRDVKLPAVFDPTDRLVFGDLDSQNQANRFTTFGSIQSWLKLEGELFDIRELTRALTAPGLDDGNRFAILDTEERIAANRMKYVTLGGLKTWLESNIATDGLDLSSLTQGVFVSGDHIPFLDIGPGTPNNRFTTFGALESWLARANGTIEISLINGLAASVTPLYLSLIHI